MNTPCADTISIFVRRKEYIFDREAKIKVGSKDYDIFNWMLGNLVGVNDLKTIKFLVEKKKFKIEKKYYLM